MNHVTYDNLAHTQQNTSVNVLSIQLQYIKENNVSIQYTAVFTVTCFHSAFIFSINPENSSATILSQIIKVKVSCYVF